MIAKNDKGMNKKILLLLALSIVNICLLHGENRTEKLVRKSNSLFRMVNDKLIELDNKAITVKLKEGKVLPKKVKAIRSNKLGYIDVEVPNDIDIEDFVANLRTTGDYELVKYNEIAETAVSSNDPELNYQWYKDAIGLHAAWDITTGRADVKVAVIDNGFDWFHEDIGYGNDNYRNIDPTLGYNFYQNSTSMTKKDHGTQVAGIISAKTNNGTGIAGVAGGYNNSGVTILPFCVTDGSVLGIDMGCVDDAICMAVDNGAKIINMSFGSNDTIQSHHVDVIAAIDYAYSHGVTLISATHNYGASYITFPACYSKVIAVGAMNQDYHRSTLSNYGNGIDLLAPGESIYSTKIDNDYDYADGTSFAAPQVAGAVALMLSVNPTLTPNQIKSTLQNTCTKLSGYTYTNGWNSEVGYGLLDAYAAVNAVAAHKIIGPELVYANGVYSIDNLQSGVTVEWSLSDTYYNQNCLQQNYPSQNKCTITRVSGYDMTNATLTATIKHNGITVQTLPRTGLYAYADFKGQYTSGNLSGNINYTHIFNVKPNEYTYITSPNFYGATASYNNIGVIPNYWTFIPEDCYLRFFMPANNNGYPVVIDVHDGCGNNYQLYAIPQNGLYLEISNGNDDITVTLQEEGNDSSRSQVLNQPWSIEVCNAASGMVMATRSSTSRSVSIPTSAWPKGLYIVKATIGKEELTEKVIVK